MAEGQGRSSGQGVKLLYIRDYLYDQATPEHPKNAKDIQTFLKGHGVTASCKTIYNDITVLKYEFKVPVEYDASKWGYYITEPKFSTRELRTLIDCVQASPHITEKEAQIMTNKIKTMANVYDRQKLNHQLYVKDRIHRRKNSILCKTDMLQQAINLGKKVSFRTFSYSGVNRGEKIYYDDEELGHVIVNPKRLIWDSGNYFLECYQKEKHEMRFHLVSSMDDIKILSSNIDKTEYKPSHDNLRDGSNPLESIMAPKHLVTIRIRNAETWLVLEEFGTDTIMVPYDENHFTISVRDMYCKRFFSKLSRFGPFAKIISPQDAIENYKKFLNHILTAQISDKGEDAVDFGSPIHIIRKR